MHFYYPGLTQLRAAKGQPPAKASYGAMEAKGSTEMMRAGMAAAIVTLGLAVGGAGIAHAASGNAVGFADGWTIVKAWSCGVNKDDLFVAYADSTGRKYLTTRDQSWYIPLSILCSNGKKFGAYVTNGVWTDITYSPSLP